MKIKCFCPVHGKLEFSDIIVKDNVACCKKCRRMLEFDEIKLKK